MRLTFFLLLINSGFLYSQNNDSLMINVFFEKLQNSKIDLKLLYNTNKWFEGKQDDISNLEYKLKETIDNIGKMYSYQKIKEKKIDGVYYIVWYIVKFDRQPLCFKFSYYKPFDKWQLQSCKYELSLDEIWLLEM